MLTLRESQAGYRAGAAAPGMLPTGMRPRTVRSHAPARRRPPGRFVDYDATRPMGVRADSRTSGLVYKRRRWAAAGAVLLVLAVGVLLGWAVLGAMNSDAGVPAETAVVQVRPGETLSGVASRVAPHAPTSAVVDRIVQLNHLPGAAVRAGQTLVVPAGT